MSTLLFPSMLVHNINSASSVTVLMGFSKYLCKGFEHNNIQMTGNWYLDAIDDDTKELREAIVVHGYKEVNFVGISKSCTGAFILAGRLAKEMPNCKFRVFAFSSYTTMAKDFFEKISKVASAPDSLVDIWESDDHRELSLSIGDARTYIGQDNLDTFLLYPARSRGVEPEMAMRLCGMKNVTLIPLEVRIHNVLFPFWRKLLPDLKIEMFEGQVKSMPQHAYDYFAKMQMYDVYTFNLYSLINDTEQFCAAMREFNSTIPALKA